MNIRNNQRMKKLLAAVFTFGLIIAIVHTTYVSSASNPSVSAGVIKLRIMETTDVHANLMSYDYKQGVPNPKVGLVRTATLIKNARKEAKNHILVDNGDLIQGTPQATYKARVVPLKKGEIHPIFEVMNRIGYDIATIGNHEFNYGLEFLEEAYNDAKFPFINANVYKSDIDNLPENDKNKYQPYRIIKKKLIDESGKKHTLKIGFLGVLPPQANEWDKVNLQGRVIVKDMLETVRKFIPELKKKGADLIIVLAHSGFSKNKGDKTNVVYPLSEIPGIDAITFSHTHKLFPPKTAKELDSAFLGPNKKPLPGVNPTKGTINGVPAVQAGSGGGSLGIIDLTLIKEKGKWKVSDSHTFTREISQTIKDPVTGKTKTVSTVTADPKLVEAILYDHIATVRYMEAAYHDTKK